MKQSSLSTLVIGALCVLVVMLAGVLFQASAQSEPSSPDDPALPAAAGPLFSYQGELRNAAGNPITNFSLPMTFRLFATATGGSTCWVESQNVNVQNGHFSVVLGQVSAIPFNCATADAYLELVVGGETLSPRELLTSVASAVRADTIKANAQTLGTLTVKGTLYTDGDIYSGGGEVCNVSGTCLTGPNFKLGSEVILHRNGAERVLHLLPYAGSGYAFDKVCIGCGTGATLRVNGSTEVTGSLVATREVSGWDLKGMNLHIGGGTAFHTNTTDRILHLLPWAGSGQAFDRVCIGCGFGNAGLIVAGNLDLRGSCTRTGLDRGESDNGNSDSCKPGNVISGAYIEANLMNDEEQAVEKIERFESGDLLCWSGETDQLEKCSIPNDPLVMGVADVNGKPIVLGAEDIKVIGRVEVGDYLVASSVPGYAIASEEPSFGIVIGQALEANDNGKGVIKAMIRKM